MERLVSMLIGRSLRGLMFARRFFIAVFALVAVVFVAVDPWSPVTWLMLGLAGLMGWMFWHRTNAMRRQGEIIMREAGRRPTGRKDRDD